MHKDSVFGIFAKWVSSQCGKPITFVLAFMLVVGWALTGPLFDYSETWQLVINTSTTIITFLMVFIIQNTQNKDTAAIQIKLDELIRATKHAHNSFMDLEEFQDEELEQIRTCYRELAQKARHHLRQGVSNGDIQEGKEDFNLIYHSLHRK